MKGLRSFAARFSGLVQQPATVSWNVRPSLCLNVWASRGSKCSPKSRLQQRGDGGLQLGGLLGAGVDNGRVARRAARQPQHRVVRARVPVHRDLCFRVNPQSCCLLMQVNQQSRLGSRLRRSTAPSTALVVLVSPSTVACGDRGFATLRAHRYISARLGAYQSFVTGTVLAGRNQPATFNSRQTSAVYCNWQQVHLGYVGAPLSNV